MRLILAGGTGFIGGRLLSALLADGHTVTLLTRGSSRPLPAGVASFAWTDPAWRKSLDGADAVINLAGEPVAGGRWTNARKRRILDSRVDSTRLLVEAMRGARMPPKVLVNASAVGIYGAREGAALDESAATGTGFLADVCAAWEREALKARALGARVVLLRIGLVLGAEGGALAKMLLPFKLGLGGRLGSGRQGFPWIHVDDVVGLIREALVNAKLDGPVNVVAPGGVDNAGFTAAMGRALHRPTIAPAPAFALKLLLGEMSEMLLTGQNLAPAAAQKAGYAFKFPGLDAALADIVK